MKTFKKATLFVLTVMVAVLGIGLQSFSENDTINIPLTVRASNPPTGDRAGVLLWPTLAALCAAVIFVTVVERKRRTCKG